MTEDTRLIDFYESRGTDHRGRTLDEIQRFSVERLEHEHDFIQWIFPLRTPSPVNPDAPVVTDVDRTRFRASAELAARLRRSFDVMIHFYGFELRERDGELQIRRGRDFDKRAQNWLHPGNHNFLRITRILASLTILGQGRLARAFLECLKEVYAEQRAVIGDRTWRFWQDAIDENG